MISHALGRRGPLRSAVDRANRWGDLIMVLWLGGVVAIAVIEQVRNLPSPPPTPEQRVAATARAEADWRVAKARLQARMADPPLELGAVWAVRSGRICGLVNIRETGVDAMTRFYTVDDQPILRRDDERRYVHEWLECLDTRWVTLNEGTERQGFCGSRIGGASPLGKLIC